ncbi:myosin heavy chain, skeletal muscle-like isoform X2 [Uloborus diversus]|uniref:myosin heavy chain, skeletal muscle-like isoform X2 n=1 Tax=Uloborus diversus TaxID=327109 RepID=UPI002409D1B0|nr:myosin heavy chain, skeletal muscle-like isoform X2 [Uloborus diversus]
MTQEMGQKCLVTLKMHRQLYKEHLSLQKSFSSLYQHLSADGSKNRTPSLFEEKNRLEAMVKHFKHKALQLQNELEDSNERCELLEFCLLELENQVQVSDSDCEDKAVNTEIDSEVWERNILNSRNDCTRPSHKDINHSECDFDEKKIGIQTTMESENYRTELEETQKKLTSLTEQLENVLKYNCKLGVGMDYVIATVNELQSLLEWTAGKKEFKADSGVIFQKLQQLERIQKDLEKTTTESEHIRVITEIERSNQLAPDQQELQRITDDHQQFKSNDKNIQEEHTNLLENNLKNIESYTSPKSLDILSQPLEEDSNLLIDLISESDDVIQNVKSKDCNEDSHDSLGTNISEDEGLGDESRRGDSTGPSSFVEIQESLIDSVSECTIVPLHPGTEIVIIDTEGHEKAKECLSDSKDSENSLNVCLCAIGNLRESLRAKENELLKLSAIQNDQVQIAALQDVILKFHKESTELKGLLEKLKKENAVLKEQVLELEEAENDARLQAQKLAEKLEFLQEKDSHFQAELAETKQSLEKCVEELSLKEIEERELRSQLKYMEALAQKYEDQIRTMEIVEIALRKKLIEQEDEFKIIEKTIMDAEPEKSERGTQTYDPRSKPIKTFDHEDSLMDDDSCHKCSKHGIIYATVDRSVQASDSELVMHSVAVDACLQTDEDSKDVHPNQLQCVLQNSISPCTEESSQDSYSMSMHVECPIQKELLKRLHQLVEEDAHLQQQLHYVDQINLTLWKKLHNLEFHIGECKKKNMSEDCTSDSCIDSECDISSRPLSREQLREDSARNSKGQSPTSSKGIITCLDQSEQEIKERLLKLEKINAAFEKELEARGKLYLEKERKYGEWVQTEQRFIGDLKRLSDERDHLINQVTQLQKEKKQLTTRVTELQNEMAKAQERYEKENFNIKAEQDEIILKFQQKVDQLLLKEKEHLKQITNLKIERIKSSESSESDKLKSSYVELQLELSKTRDTMRKKEDEFRMRLEECKSKHILEEARLVSELEMLRNKNLNCDELIKNFQIRQEELIIMLHQKEKDMEQARDEYKKSMEATEEEHRTLEAELKYQLRQMEEGTAVATRVLTEERMRIEKELQENIDDLRSKEEVYKARISELENNVSRLHQELHRITGDLDSGFSSDMSSDGISNFRREKLMNQLRELRDRETELREKLDEMEQKEAAYRETLEHADRIVASVEQGYKNKIAELEISEKNLKQRVGHLEEVESCLRGALHKERRSSDGRKPDDLVVELLEAEARENGLKEKIEMLEQLHRNASNKVRDLEKIREKLEGQVNDRDELSSDLRKTQQELETARKSLAKLKKSESDLKTSLQQTENVLTTTESQLQSKIKTIEEEKKGLEETIHELRNQVRGMKKKLERISDVEEDISFALPTKPVAPLSVKTLKNTNVEDIDYAEIDDSYGVPYQPTTRTCASKTQTPRPYQTSSLPSANRNKANVTSAKEMTANKIKDGNFPDSCDDARQNLEDCMLRAMAAMKMDMQNKVSPIQTASEDNDYDDILPRPTNFRVVQQVGSDTLLVGWDYVNPSVLEGFEVYLDGQLHETVYTPDRTKALIIGLNLKRPLQLSICALSREGQMSDPAVLDLPPQDKNNRFQDDGDEDSLCDEYSSEKQRPYSMEW